MYSFIDPRTNQIMREHADFYLHFISGLKKKTKKRKFFFGGGAGGGKTYMCLFCILSACRLYPQFRAHIIRKSMSGLQKTVEPSLTKLMDGQKYKTHRDKGNYFFEFQNGSRIFLMPESFSSDKDLDAFKGLETNLIFLEQIEELQQKTYFKSIERAGRYIIHDLSQRDQPAPMILSTMNPTKVSWIRELIYDPWVSNKVPADTFIQMVTAKHNPYIPQELWDNWRTSDPLMYKQFIEGDWNACVSGVPYMYAFQHRHIQETKIGATVWLSFDFNATPMTAIMATVNADKNQLWIHREFYDENSTAEILAKNIYPFINGKQVFITGDATGKNANVFTTKNLYQIICGALKVPQTSVKLHKKNFMHVLSRELCNLVLHDTEFDIKVDPSCKKLIDDLNNVQVLPNGKPNKNDQDRTHLFDTFRYLVHWHFIDKVKNRLFNSHLFKNNDND